MKADYVVTLRSGAVVVCPPAVEPLSHAGESPLTTPKRVAGGITPFRFFHQNEYNSLEVLPQIVLLDKRLAAGSQ